MKKDTLLLIIAVIIMMTACGEESNKVSSYVRENGTGDGSSWENAMGDLQKAIDAAGSDSEIWVAAGTYNPVRSAADGAKGNGGCKNAFVMQEGVHILGGFPPTGNPSKKERDWEAYPTILSGDLNKNNVLDDFGEDAYHVVIAVNITKHTTLHGFTISGGSATEKHDHMNVRGVEIFGNNGGGIYNANSRMTINNVTIIGNKAFGSGGGMYNDKNSCPTVTNATISNNFSRWNGGGIFNANESKVILTNAIISENISRGSGGGVYNSLKSDSQFRDVAFIKNETSYQGSGMESFMSSPVLIRVVFRENKGSIGALLNSTSSSTTLINVTFDGNKGHYEDKGMSNYDSSPKIQQNVVTMANNSESKEFECLYQHDNFDVRATVSNGKVTLHFEKYDADKNEYKPKDEEPVTLSASCKAAFIGDSHPVLCCVLEDGGIETLDVSKAFTTGNFQASGRMSGFENIVSVITGVQESQESYKLTGMYAIDKEGNKKEIK